MKKQAVTGIILAGGASRRMGMDKGLCNFNGKELVRYSIDLLLPICNNLLISSNNEALYSKFGYPIIVDAHKNIGPLGGIYSCLKQSATTDNLVLSCDMPFLSSELLRTVLSLSESYDIVVPQHNNSYLEPLAAYYSVSIIPIIEESIANDDFKLINLFNKVRTKIVMDEDDLGSIKQFKNFNTPQDLL